MKIAIITFIALAVALGSLNYWGKPSDNGKICPINVMQAVKRPNSTIRVDAPLEEFTSQEVLAAIEQLNRESPLIAQVAPAKPNPAKPNPAKPNPAKPNPAKPTALLREYPEQPTIITVVDRETGCKSMYDEAVPEIKYLMEPRRRNNPR